MELSLTLSVYVDSCGDERSLSLTPNGGKFGDPRDCSKIKIQTRRITFVRRDTRDIWWVGWVKNTKPEDIPNGRPHGNEWVALVRWDGKKTSNFYTDRFSSVIRSAKNMTGPFNINISNHLKHLKKFVQKRRLNTNYTSGGPRIHFVNFLSFNSLDREHVLDGLRDTPITYVTEWGSGHVKL